MRDVGQNVTRQYFFRFRPQKWTYLGLPLIEKKMLLVLELFCDQILFIETDKIRILRQEINYLGDFNSEDLVKMTFCIIYLLEKEV